MMISKNLQRKQADLAGEKELKNTHIRKYQDDHNKSTLKLGEQRSKKERQEREEAALRELQDTLKTLQAELKVDCQVYLMFVPYIQLIPVGP